MQKLFNFFLINFILKFKQHPINIKNYTAQPHAMVHVAAKFGENTLMRFRVTVRKLNVTDRRTDGRTNIYELRAVFFCLKWPLIKGPFLRNESNLYTI